MGLPYFRENSHNERDRDPRTNHVDPAASPILNPDQSTQDHGTRHRSRTLQLCSGWIHHLLGFILVVGDYVFCLHHLHFLRLWVLAADAVVQPSVLLTERKKNSVDEKDICTCIQILKRSWQRNTTTLLWARGVY
jgi:hypothetical protein